MGVKEIIDLVPMLLTSLAEGRGVKYKRLSDAVGQAIRDDAIPPGHKLPPHRILAHTLKVTTGTISRAYSELERVGLVVSRVGDGTYVRDSGYERRVDKEFRNFTQETPQFFDMSRNMHIQGKSSTYLADSLRVLANNVSSLSDLISYAPDAGLTRHREAGAKWLKQRDFSPSPDQVICVNGGQHGLLCTLMALARSGDTIVTEQLTYPGLITAARILGIKLVGLLMDEEGLLPNSLDEICRTHRVTALYCTPTIQSPTCSVMSAERRKAIVQICQKHNLLIIEDDAHAVLISSRPAPLCSYAPERTILISSLSKVMPTGLRVGYLHVPVPLIGRLSTALRSSCWMATPLPLELVTNWIVDGIADQLVRLQVSEIHRRKALVQRLLFGLEHKSHVNSPHFWIKVPEPFRSTEIQTQLKSNGYLITTAEAFAVGHTAVPQFIRASVCSTSDNDRQLIDAFTTLASILSWPDERFSL